MCTYEGCGWQRSIANPHACDRSLTDFVRCGELARALRKIEQSSAPKAVTLDLIDEDSMSPRKGMCCFPNRQRGFARLIVPDAKPERASRHMCIVLGRLATVLFISFWPHAAPVRQRQI